MCQTEPLRSYYSHDIYVKDDKLYPIVHAYKLCITVLQTEFRAVVKNGSTRHFAVQKKKLLMSLEAKKSSLHQHLIYLFDFSKCCVNTMCLVLD